VLPDGSYDVFVVDATTDDEDPSHVELSLTVVAGDHKGDVLTVHAQHLGVDELDLLGMPGTLAVEGGVPSFSVDS
jgi:hypothetical protein